MFLDFDTFALVVKHAPLVAVDLIVHNPAGQVLLGMRNNAPAQGFWFVPGGRILKQERLHSAVERLTFEELGVRLDTSRCQFMGIYEHLYRENFFHLPDFGTHYIGLAHTITIDLDLAALPGRQHRSYSWFSIENILTDTRTHPYTRAYFQDRPDPLYYRADAAN